MKQEDKKYRLLYETSRDAIMTLEPPTWEFTAGNEAAVKMFGTTSEDEFISLTPQTASPEKQPDGQLSSVKAKKMIEKALKEGSAFFEWTHSKLDGSTFPATVLLTKIFTPEKVYLQATVRDITEQKNIEDELKESKDKFKSILDAVTVGILAADSKTKKFIFVNPKMCELTGYSEEELLRMDVSKIHPKDDLPRVMEAFEKQARGEIKIAEALPVLRKDDKIIYCDVSATLEKISKNEFLLGIFMDVTERELIQNNLKNKVEELEKTNKLMVGRELIMIELKEKIKKLEGKK